MHSESLLRITHGKREESVYKANDVRKIVTTRINIFFNAFRDFAMAPYIDPVNQAALNALAKLDLPPLEDLPIPELRKVFDQIQEHTPIPGVTETSFKVPFQGRQVEAFLFKPEGAKGPLPTILYLHGGGWIFGEYVRAFDLNQAISNQESSVKGYDSICRELVLGTDFALVFVQYSLAPEKKFPTQQEECLAVAQFITKNGSKHGLITDKIAIVGDSAGGSCCPCPIPDPSGRSIPSMLTLT